MFHLNKIPHNQCWLWEPIVNDVETAFEGDSEVIYETVAIF